MALQIDLSTLTIPTPEPYDKKNPEQQRENMAFVALQILQQVAAFGTILEIPTTIGVEPNGSMQGVEDAIRDLLAVGYSVKIGPVTFVKHGQIGLAAVQEG
jgi:hypothetical protein